MCDNRPRFSNGGNYGQRTCRPPTSDQIAFGRPIGRRNLPDCSVIPGIGFNTLVASVSSQGPNGLFDLTRSNLQPRRISAELERTIVGIRRRLASQTHPGTRDSLIGASSILAELQDLAHPSFARCPDRRACARAQRRNGSAGASGTLSGSQYLSQAASQLLQSAASSRCGRSDLSQGQPPALLHFHLQGRVSMGRCT